jgi:AcrR family transcriptional regulator
MMKIMAQQRLTREEARGRTRRAILAAARALFTEHGYRGASLDDIAETAGYSKGAVYSNWPSKEALFLELLDEERTDGTGGMSTTAGPWQLATLEFFVEAVRSPETRQELAARYQQARRDIGAAVGRGRPHPPWATWDEVAAAAMAIGTGLIIQTALDPDAIHPELANRVIGRLLGDDTHQTAPPPPTGG